MWQTINGYPGKYHCILGQETAKIIGAMCGQSMPMLPDFQRSYVDADKRCKTCEAVWRLIATSIDDAKQTLRGQNNLEILHLAAAQVHQKTLRKAIEAKIRKLEKEAENAG